MFCIGDKIVHPMHGAGIVENIIEQCIDGKNREYYVLKMPIGGMLVMIPIKSCDEIGIRPVVDNDRAQEIMESLTDIEVDVTQNWNKALP